MRGEEEGQGGGCVRADGEREEGVEGDGEGGLGGLVGGGFAVGEVGFEAGAKGKGAEREGRVGEQEEEVVCCCVGGDGWMAWGR